MPTLWVSSQQQDSRIIVEDDSHDYCIPKILHANMQGFLDHSGGAVFPKKKIYKNPAKIFFEELFLILVKVKGFIFLFLFFENPLKKFIQCAVTSVCWSE